MWNSFTNVNTGPLLAVLDFTLSHLTVGEPPLAMIDAAAEAGFRSAGLRIAARRHQEAFQVEVIGQPQAVREIREHAAARGVRIASVNAFQLYPDVGWRELAPLADTVIAIGAPIVIVNSFDPDEGRVVELLARFAEPLAQGGVRIAVEFLPYSQLRSLPQTLRVLDRSGARNAGVLVDLLHLDRSGGTPADVMALDPSRIVFAQLCDARRLGAPLPDAELMAQARTSRLELLDGDLPLVEFVDAMPAGIELEYESIRADLAGRPGLERARAARADCDRFARAYAGRSQRPRDHAAAAGAATAAKG